MTGAGVRIGNASGFYGDRESAVREMLTGGDLHYLTGDYLAELTMLILAMDRLKDPGRGFARSFLRQMEEGLGLALDAGVKVVVNAGGLNPAALATAVRDQAERLGLTASVAHVEGADLLPRAGELGRTGPGGVETWGKDLVPGSVTGLLVLGGAGVEDDLGRAEAHYRFTEEDDSIKHAGSFLRAGEPGTHTGTPRSRPRW